MAPLAPGPGVRPAIPRPAGLARRRPVRPGAARLAIAGPVRRRRGRRGLRRPVAAPGALLWMPRHPAGILVSARPGCRLCVWVTGHGHIVASEPQPPMSHSCGFAGKPRAHATAAAPHRRRAQHGADTHSPTEPGHSQRAIRRSGPMAASSRSHPDQVARCAEAARTWLIWRRSWGSKIEVRSASITSMIRHYVARKAKVTEDHPHNAAERAMSYVAVGS